MRCTAQPVASRDARYSAAVVLREGLKRAKRDGRPVALAGVAELEIVLERLATLEALDGTVGQGALDRLEARAAEDVRIIAALSRAVRRGPRRRDARIIAALSRALEASAISMP